MQTSQVDWFKSSYSGGEGGECVEVTSREESICVRDSKDPEGPPLDFTPDAWAAFVRFARS